MLERVRLWQMCPNVGPSLKIRRDEVIAEEDGVGVEKERE